MLIVACASAALAKVRVYKGIRYAEPPIGPRRFLPAEQAPFNESDLTHPRLLFGHDCVQASRPLHINEDCLYINIWTPAPPKPTQLLPVMVWIHGGGFSAGSGRDYDGSVLAASQNVVVVTLNYRLGALGFYANEDLLDANTSTPTNGGMNGILDQIVALQFVREHIYHFGGNAQQITLFGQSAGAVSVCTLVSAGISCASDRFPFLSLLVLCAFGLTQIDRYTGCYVY